MALTHATWITYTKANWVTWETWCTHPDADIAAVHDADELLEQAVTKACNEWGHYRDDADADMSDSMSEHLLNIIKYHCFMYHHENTQFENDPLIVANYKKTKELLDKHLIGSGNVALNARDRIFDEGFVDNESLWYET